MTTFSPAVFAAPPFAEYRALAPLLGAGPTFPTFEIVDAALSSFAAVRFVAPLPRRRRGAPVVADDLYDARIVRRGEVPTRTCWHDLANALVWARFPLSKRALHARQLRAITQRLAPDATQLPGARTAEQDALAMLDEGGLLVVPTAGAPAGSDAETLRVLCQTGRARVHVFGHALLEHVAEQRSGDILAAVVRLDALVPPDEALSSLLSSSKFPERRGDLGSLWLQDALREAKASLRRGRAASLLRHRMADAPSSSRKSPLNSTRLDQTRAVASDPSSSTVRRRVGVFLITSGEDTGRVIRVPHGAVVSFGRSHECTVQLPDEGLSRIHSRCLRLGEAYMLDDNKSTNGTYVNGRKITSATQLADGDAVGLGRATKLRFTIMDEGEAETLEEIYLARRSGKSALITADLEQDLAQAREFQQRLLRQHPMLPGVEIDVLYQPVDQVGGDVYQMHVLSDGSLRMFVADAVGHGVQASLTTMLIVSEYEATRHIQSPAAALAALNEALVTKFAHARVQFTAACVDVRFREREIVFAAAGHPAPCVVRAGVFEELEAVGPILGIVPGISMSESTVDLADGDHLLLFTDGCTEVFDGSDVFGDEGLQRTALSAISSNRKISEAVAAALMSFSRGKPLADDATLLAVSFRSVGETVRADV